MNAAELLVQCLESEGVKYIFGLPGEENLAFLEALSHSQIQFIATRHEQGAAFMADVYGRLTGQAGVCLSTLGPGATNLITGVADANMDHAPLVAIAGQAATTRLHKESHQVLNLQDVFQPITKYSAIILEPEIIPEVTRKAFKIAQTPKQGATFIELPENIADFDTHEKPLHIVSDPLIEPFTLALQQAAKIIEQAQYPIILAGNGVIRSHASQALSKFASKLHIPVANTFMAKGVVPFKHPQALGSVGLQANDYVNSGFNKADVILCIGYDLVEYHPHLWHPTKDRIIIHIDNTPHEVDAHYPVALAIIGNIANSLIQLAKITTINHQQDIMRPLRQALIEDIKQHANDTVAPLKPQKIIWDLRTVMELEDIVVCDVGAHKMWMARMFRCEYPNTCLISNGFASMGIAVPGAIAAKLVHPERNVVAVTGDGGFLMNIQEIETAIRYKLPIIILVWNDGGYGLIAWKQQNKYQYSRYTDFNNPDFVKLAEAFGAKGYRVERAQDLQEILKDAIQSQQVCIIDCPVDYTENIRLTHTLGEIISLI